MEIENTSFENLPVLLTVNTLQKVLSISRTKVYELINQDGFPVLRLGRSVRIPKDALYSWLKNNTSN